MHLAADMPAARIAARGLMDLRIARKVACLSGIAGPPESSDDAGRGHAWFSDYQALTLTELTVGGPMLTEPPPSGFEDAGMFRRAGRKVVVDGVPDADVAPIPNVTLNQYGPDTKAAVVLTGVNRVLAPVSEALLAAMHDIRRQIDSPHLLVAVGQCLLQEAFAAQPILILNGIQASRIQRAHTTVSNMVSRPAPGRVARVEYGWPAPPNRHSPLEVGLIYDLWNAMVAPRGAAQDGTQEIYDRQGRLRADPDAEPYLRATPPHGFEQNDPLAADGREVLRDRLVSILRQTSESAFIGGTRGAPRCSVMLVDRPDRATIAEVVVPRQQQVETLLARVDHHLSPLRPARPPAPGSALTLPTLEVEHWAGADLLHRRAIVLAHYYTLRAAGWIAGMTRLDRRRSRDDTADRCVALADATKTLLPEDDPLHDQIVAFTLGYTQHYESSLGRGAPHYSELLDALGRMRERVDRIGRGRAELWETLQLALPELNTVRRAASYGLHHAPSARMVTDDLTTWWDVARDLREKVIVDAGARRYLDHEYATFLIGAGSDADAVVAGLKILSEVIELREQGAQLSGRSLHVQRSYAGYLGGLSRALEEKVDPARAAEWAQEAVATAEQLEDNADGGAYLAQRTLGAGEDEPVSFDGAALHLLITLAEGWVSAVRSGALPPGRESEAVNRAQRAVERMRGYLERASRSASAAGDLLGTSQVDLLRRRMVERVEQRWAAQS